MCVVCVSEVCNVCVCGGGRGGGGGSELKQAIKVFTSCLEDECSTLIGTKTRNEAKGVRD